MDDPTNEVPEPGPAAPAHASDGPRPPGGAPAWRDRLRRARRRLAHALRAARTWRPRHGWWAATGLVAAALLVSVAFGVTTATTQGALGPHVTRYDVTTDSTVTIDFGPLGTLQTRSPLPLALGVRATVGEIPASVTELGQARTLQALGEDLSAYVAFFSGPAAAVEDIARALVSDALVRTAWAFVVLVAVWWAVRLLLGPDRRRQLARPLATHARPVTAGVVAVVVGATVLTSSVAPGDRPGTARLASSVFDGTPLEGAWVTGRLGGVIDTYGVYAVDAWRENEEFYQTADDALAVAWEQWEADEVRLAAEEAAEQEAAEQAAAEQRAAEQEAAAQAAAGGEATPDALGTGEAGAPDGGTAGDTPADGALGDGAPADGALGDGAPADGALDEGGTGGARSTATATPTPTPQVEPVVLVVVSDLHCNVGMAPVIGTLARLAGADAVLDAGDTTMNGTSVEQYCVTSFARAVPDGVQLVTAPGNHDSADTSGQYARAGALVLDGEVVEVAGVRILGDSDPNETRVGAGGTASARGETPAEAAERLAEVACDDGDVDLLLVHNPVVGDTALDEGCVPAQVSGHYHRRSGPEQVGLGVRYVSSSTAGATLNQPTVGPLRGVAELTVLRVDPVSGNVVDHQLVQVAPDATVTVNRPQPWPEVVVPRDDAVTDVDDVTPPADDGAAPGAGDPARTTEEGG
ncbi:metallophosphoesterase family protein [Cellulomonas wangsupingiae]|uniref:metallophosphoesterase family protein n=1 Tax=Cellulomonas wangsupingiae TaxID=2968085 RepID=UPI00202F5E49|nr:metallophosphoesterase [Cellulomonas wangsupingiae]MCM0641459.1 metallophosphoesterase [Cellulomonas wangsupingiae]